jgi:hypothetical protein
LLVVAVYRWRGASFDWHRFGALFLDLHPGWMLLSILLILSTYAGRVIRWEVMLRPLQPRSDFWALLNATAIGFTAIVLFGRPGEVVRPYLIALKSEVSFSSQLAAWFLERVYDLLAVFLLVGIALAGYGQIGLGSGPTTRWILQIGGKLVLMASLASLAILIMARHFSERLAQRLAEALGFLPPALHKKVEGIVHAFVEGMESTKSAVSVAKIVVFTAIEWALIVLSIHCLFLAVPETSSMKLIESAVFVGFIALGSIVQLPGVGGGMQVVSVVVLTELFGTSLETATGLALLIWLVTFAIIVPFGLVLAAREGLKWSQLRHIEDNSGI